MGREDRPLVFGPDDDDDEEERKPNPYVDERVHRFIDQRCVVMQFAQEQQIASLPWGPTVDVIFDPMQALTSALTLRLYAEVDARRSLIASAVVDSLSPKMLSAGVGCDRYVLTAQLAADPVGVKVTSFVSAMSYEGSRFPGEGRQAATSWSELADLGVLESKRLISPAPGLVLACYGTNPTATDYYIHLFDKVAEPGAAAKGGLVRFVAKANSNFSLDLARGREFTTGVYWGTSTALATYVAAPANLLSLSCEMG